MQKFKFVKKNDVAAFYKLKDRKLFGDKLLAQIEWPAGVQRLVFDFAPCVPRGGYLNPPVSKKYSVRVASYAAKKDIKVPAGFKPVPGLELIPVESSPAFRKLVSEKFHSFYVRPIRKYVAKSFIKECDNFYAGNLKNCSNMMLTYKGRGIGVVSTMPSNVKGKPGTLVPWVFIYGKLPAPAAASVRPLIAQWLRKQTKGRIGTIEHAQSLKTQKFFSSIGFKPARYTVEPMT